MDCNYKFYNKELGYSIIFDDNGRVAYAYLISPENKIVADVWLYNCCKSPSSPEWKYPKKMPFANPIEYVKDEIGFSPVRDKSEINVKWELKEDIMKAYLFIRGELFAVVAEGSKPGWSNLAKKNGPIAKVMEKYS